MLRVLATRLLLATGILLGVFCIAVGFLSAWERYETEAWTMREAIITESELSSSQTAKGRGWHPGLSAKFLDDGREMPVSVAYGRWLGWNDQIKRTASDDVARYPVGRIVTVYQPYPGSHQAVLERHPWTERIVLVPLGFMLLAAPLLAWRLRRKTSGQD